MATVYRARDEVLGVERAVKVLRPELMENARLRDRFEGEARTMARIRHPNVVSVYDFVLEGSRAALVMDFVEGGCLADLLEEQGPLAPPAALAVCHELAAGLAAVHDSGIIHRDLKPQNVLIELDGTPRLTDFGIARDAELAHKLTRTGTVLGTLAYMPPEQREDATALDHRADIYALGATLYTLVTGRAPYDLYAQEFYDRLFEGVPHIVRRVVTRACAFHPADRYPTAQELGADLASLLHSEDGSIADLLPRPNPRGLAPLASPSRETFYDDMVEHTGSFDSSIGDPGTLGDPGASPAPASREPVEGATRADPPTRGGSERLPALLAAAAVILLVTGGTWAAWPTSPTPATPMAPAAPGPNAVAPITDTQAAPEAPNTPQSSTTSEDRAAMPTPRPPAPDSDTRGAPGGASRLEPEPVRASEPGRSSTPARRPASTTAAPPEDAARASLTSRPPGQPAAAMAAPATEPTSRPEPAITAKGQVFLNSVPWSRVLVDGVEVGRTPWRGSLSTGTRRVTLQPASGPPHSLPVTVSRTRETSLCWSFLDNGPCPQ